MGTQTVRIAAADHAILSAVARETGEPMTALLSEAIREMQQRHLLQRTNKAYEKLRANNKAWREELRERTLWDQTLADGIR